MNNFHSQIVRNYRTCTALISISGVLHAKKSVIAIIIVIKAGMNGNVNELRLLLIY